MVPVPAAHSAFQVHRSPSSPFLNPINHTPRDSHVIHIKNDIRVDSTHRQNNTSRTRKKQYSYSVMPPDLTAAAAPAPVIATTRRRSRSQSARPRPRSAGWGSKKEEEIHRGSQNDARDSVTEELAKFFSSTPPPWEPDDVASGGGQKLGRSRSKISRTALNLFRAGGSLAFKRGDHPRQQQKQANEDGVEDAPGNQFFVERRTKHSGKKYRQIAIDGEVKKAVDVSESSENDNEIIVLPSETASTKGRQHDQHGDVEPGDSHAQREGLGIRQSHPHLLAFTGGSSGVGVEGSSSGMRSTPGAPARAQARPGTASPTKAAPKHGSSSTAVSSNQTPSTIPKSTVATAILAARDRGTNRVPVGHLHPSDPATSSSPVLAQPNHANLKLSTRQKAIAADHGFPSGSASNVLSSFAQDHAATREPDTRKGHSFQLAKDAVAPSLTSHPHSIRPVVNHLAALVTHAPPPRTSSRKITPTSTESAPPVETRTSPSAAAPSSTSKSSSDRPVRNESFPTASNKSIVPDGLSIRSSMQSGTGSSDTSSAIVMDAEERKLIHARVNGLSHNGSSKPPKPGPAPTRDLPSLPSGYDRSRNTNKSRKRGAIGEGNPTKPPPRSPMREVAWSTDPSGPRTPFRIDTTLASTQAPTKSPTDSTSATSARSMFSTTSQSQVANGARAEKVRALKARDLSSIRARYENKKLEESQALEEAAKEGEKLINDPTISMPRSSPILIEQAFGQKSASRRVSSNSPLNTSRSSLRRQNALTPVFLVMEQEPTTGRYRTGGFSPHLPHRRRSGQSLVTSNGTHTPPRSASPSLPSSDDEGYGTQGVPKSNTNKSEQSASLPLLQQRRQNHPATPVTPFLNIDTTRNRSSGSGPDAELALRVAALERTNKLLEDALFAVINTAASMNGPLPTNVPSSLSSAGPGRRPESGLSAISLGSMSTTGGGDRALEAIISFLQGQKEGVL